MTAPSSPDLVQALARRHHARVVETHISWVLLGDEFAWKIKKPVRLPFVDYSTLAARRHFCEEELRLNRRLAAGLYLGLSRITGGAHGPEFDGEGPLLEVAVRMRRFPDGALFSERLLGNRLEAADVDRLAALLADFHASAPVVDAAAGLATAAMREAAALSALAGAGVSADASWRAGMQRWLAREAAVLAPAWARRLAAGRVRECHGDLHLDNLLCLDDSVSAFDCIEFEPALRNIDVLDDIAFPVMDLAARGRSDFAFRLLNAWLDASGDHDALTGLRFAAVYRALVRAQVAQLRGGAQAACVLRYLAAAQGWTEPVPARLWITHGLPGSGKSFYAQRLLEQQGAVRLRSDVERKRLFGLHMHDDSHALGLDLYTSETTQRTYERLFALARNALAHGFPVVLDAAFLLRSEREQARRLAQEAQVPFQILVCEAPLDVLQDRLHRRRGDPSEADAGVLEKLLPMVEPLTPDEARFAVPAEQPGKG